MLAILVTLVEGLHLQRPIRPRLPAAAAARLPADAAVAPLLAAAPFPASAAVSHGPLSDVTLALAGRGDGSEGLLASITRDPTDVYYGVLVLIGLFFLVKNLGSAAIDDARDFDRRSELANKARADFKKRERADRLDKVKRNDPAYDRLQQEANERSKKKKGWKVFDPD